MALQKQLVHLNLTGGIQTKDDERLSPPSKLNVADNVEFDDASTVIRRGGQVKVITGDTSTSPPVRAVALDNGAIVVEHTDGAQRTQQATPVDFGYWSGSSPTTEPGTFMRVGASTRRLQAGWAESSDMAYGTSTYCVATSRVVNAVTGNWAVDLRIFDAATDQVLASYSLQDTTISGGYQSPRVLFDQTNSVFALFVFEDKTSLSIQNVNAYRVNADGSSASLGAATFITGSTSAAMTFAPLLDASISQGNGYTVAMCDPGVGSIRIRQMTLGLLPATATVTHVPAAAPKYLCAHSYLGNLGYVFYATGAAGGNLYGVFQNNTGAIGGSGIVSTFAGKYLGRITSYGTLTVVLDVHDSTTSYAPSNYVLDISPGSVAPTAVTGIDSRCFISGRPFTMRGATCMPVVYKSKTYQSSLFVLNLTEARRNLGGTSLAKPSFVARIDYGDTSPDTLGYLSYTNTAYAGTLYGDRVPNADYRLILYTKFDTDLRLVGVVNTTPTALAMAKLDPTGQLGDVTVNGLVFMAGALPLLCDGKQIVEEGFNWAPEVYVSAMASSGTITVSPVATGTGIYTFPAVGTYTFVFTEAWIDAQGNFHESAPSSYCTVTTTAGNLDINPTITRPATLKNGSFLNIYRTLASSTNTSLYLGALRFDGTAFVGESDDGTLPYNEQIYTSGGVLPNTPAPACRSASVFQRRVVLTGCGDGSKVYWSKQFDSGYGVEFCSGDVTHYGLIPADKGRAVASHEMDDKLVVFCERGIGIFYGNGPASTGTQGQYSEFNTIVTETGIRVDAPKSAERSPEGVWFQSPYGMRLLSRSLTLARLEDGKWVGSEVDPSVSGTVVAVTSPAKQQVRFYQSSGTVLVYDYHWQDWTRFTGAANVDALSTNSKFYHLSALPSGAAMVRYFADTLSTDTDDSGAAGTTFKSYIETSWVALAGFQGFQRVYRLMMMGRVLGTAPTTTYNINGYVGFNYVTPTYGAKPAAETFTGTLTPAGNGFVQAQHHFSTQKCESLRIGIEFWPASGSERLRLTDLTLQVGAKFGYFKLPSSQRI